MMIEEIKKILKENMAQVKLTSGDYAYATSVIGIEVLADKIKAEIIKQHVIIVQAVQRISPTEYMYSSQGSIDMIKNRHRRMAVENLLFEVKKHITIEESEEPSTGVCELKGKIYIYQR